LKQSTSEQQGLEPSKGQRIEEHKYDEQADFSDYDESAPSVPTPWTLPPRTSSKTLPLEEIHREVTSLPLQPTRRRMTTTEHRPSFRNGGFWSDAAPSILDQEKLPPVPPLSQSTSLATLKSSPPLTPLEIFSPREDQIRREMENHALHEGPETLELRYKKRRPPMLQLFGSDDEDDETSSRARQQDQDRSGPLDSDQKSISSGKTRRQRSRSILSIFQRRSPVEKLIDMYFEDEPEEKPSLKRFSTKSRKSSPTQASMPNTPPIPPLPQSNHSRKQTSLG